jgi:hypothetical protein
VVSAETAFYLQTNEVTVIGHHIHQARTAGTPDSDHFDGCDTVLHTHIHQRFLTSCAAVSTLIFSFICNHKQETGRNRGNTVNPSTLDLQLD